MRVTDIVLEVHNCTTIKSVMTFQTNKPVNDQPVIVPEHVI